MNKGNNINLALNEMGIVSSFNIFGTTQLENTPPDLNRHYQVNNILVRAESLTEISSYTKFKSYIIFLKFKG